MILTVTPNSAIDRVIFVRGFRLGEKAGAVKETFTPAGKGVGASLAIHELGGVTLATGLAAGSNGRRYRAMLDEMGIAHEFVEAEGETRMCVVLVDLQAERQSTISVPCLRATPDHLETVAEVLQRRGRAAWGAAFGGSLPVGAPSDAYADLVLCARRLGLYTLLDTSGEALRHGVAGLPHILKVNEEELSALGSGRAGGWPDGLEALPAYTSHLRRRIGEWASDAIVVTLGQRGLVAATPTGMYHARGPRVPVVNTAGAGDALTGGLLMSLSVGASWRDALALGTAAAASVVMNEGTGVCRREQVDELYGEVLIEAW